MGRVGTSRVIRRAFGVAALCVWCGWASGFDHSTVGALTTWAASLGGVVVIDVWWWRSQRGRWPGLRRPADAGPAGQPPPQVRRSATARRTWPWWALVVVVVAWEALGIDTGRRSAHLTVSALAQAFRPMHAALLAAWILVGLAFGAIRARADEPEGAAASPAGPPTPALGALGVGAAASARGAAGPLGHPGVALLLPDDRAAGVAFWVGVLVVAVLLEVGARRWPASLAGAAEMVRLVSGPPVARVLLVVAWTYAGWHLFAH